MKHLTVRNVPPELSQALAQEKERSGDSLNQTVIRALCRGLGLDSGGAQRNGFAELGGHWTQADFDEFKEAVSFTEAIDDEMWR